MSQDKRNGRASQLARSSAYPASGFVFRHGSQALMDGFTAMGLRQGTVCMLETFPRSRSPMMALYTQVSCPRMTLALLSLETGLTIA